MNSTERPFVDYTKQLIFVRKDLKMPAGKFGAQVGHAVLSPILKMMLSIPESETSRVLQLRLVNGAPIQQWIDTIFTKVLLRVDSEQELRDVHAYALEKGFISSLIIDAGKTVFNGIPTPTCVGLAPDFASVLDPHFRKFPLYPRTL